MKSLHRISLLALTLATALGVPCAQALERSWSYTYNSLGLIETADGPRTDVQDVTTYVYDAQGRLTQVTNALGHVTQLSNFDTYGNPQTLVDANGVTTTPDLHAAGLAELRQHCRKQHKLRARRNSLPRPIWACELRQN